MAEVVVLEESHLNTNDTQVNPFTLERERLSEMCRSGLLPSR